MNLLKNLLLVLLVILTISGLATGAYVQMELFKPGMNVFSDFRLMPKLLKVHALTLSIGLPVSIFLITNHIVFLQNLRAKMRNLVSTIIVLAGLGFLAGTVVQVLNAKPMTNQIYDNSAVAVVLILILFIQSVLLFGRVKSVSAKIYTIASLVPILLAFLYMLYIKNAGDIASSTYMMNAVKHAEGLALVCLLFAHLSIWIEKNVSRLSLIVTIIHVALIITAGIAMVQAQASLGLRGMPRGYPDYPSDFASGQFFNSLFGFVFTALILVGFVRIIIARRKSDPTIEVF